ncbi:MAG: type I-U CRISPR-associated helicase/endonuclease Cas3 [Lentisphaerae bacterium]|nr:type I-U CRISPR-associated helicase/endonuclease Cas3 [Lentisphaerota bacterium]
MNDFASMFEKATGHPPFPWQCALYNRFSAGDIPEATSIPTGLGKTSVLAIWMIALAMHPCKVPRRLVYVVNRRTVVDQTTTEAQKLLAALKEPGLTDLKQRLHDLCALTCESPLAISTLRGQFADNGEWRRDPARPAIIIGTVDMIGSGLLFSRYTAGFRTRPLHAAFLGQDALLVHDEAHLEPAFQLLLEEIAAVQKNSDFRPLRIMALTATSRLDSAPFTITQADQANKTAKTRYQATKMLSLIPLGDDAPDHAIVKKTKDLTGKVLVFVRSVETALKISSALDKGEHKGRVIHLTGTMRGKERDDLVNDPRFLRFLGSDGSSNVSPVFLICTSAGEVGVNLSADHCVCDLSTYESMAQRFGRVNRFGARDDSTITVFHETVFGKKNKKNEENVKTPLDAAREKTLSVLRDLNGDASPKNLAQHPALDAFAPLPKMRVATDVQFDAWALTSIREPIAARPPIAPYLHGETEWQPPETHVAWRNDYDFDTRVNPEDFIEIFPLHPSELLRDATKRIVETLGTLIKDRDNPPDAWLIDDYGSISRYSLVEFDKERALIQLANSTLILPESLGGLENGLFTGKGIASDVSGIERRDSVTRDATADFTLDLAGETVDEPMYRKWFAPSETQTGWQSTNAKGSVSLADHTAAVTANVRVITAKLGLSSDVQAAIAAAAEHHDDGKARVLWQYAIGNRDYPETVLAKSSGNVRSTAESYRHEFGSLPARAESSPDFDLTAHVIAAHHGRARPFFPAAEIFDPERAPAESHSIASAIPQRFATLQLTYGRWGLAYLESILRAADYAASAGIVANGATPAQISSSPGKPRVHASCVTDAISLVFDPTNPGHFFACCGLFEFAYRQHPGTTAHFDGNNFIIHAPTTLENVLESIVASEITAVDETDKPLTPVRINRFNLYLDWWRHEGGAFGKLKTWAGQMNVCGIANDMRQAIAKEIGRPNCRLAEILFLCSKGNSGQPYYFDSNYAVNAQAQDVGFSIDKLGKGGVNIIPATRPAVEFLCLVGLQRARPLLAVSERGKERLYDYHTWSNPIHISLVPAAVAGLLSCKSNHYRFGNPSRAKDYRAFMPAKILNP